MVVLRIAVEGHGERDAVPALVGRVAQKLGVALPALTPPMRLHQLHVPAGLERAVNLATSKGDTAGLLIVRDEDDACPGATAPEQARTLAAMAAPFPCALVLMHREFETLFLASADVLAGRLLRDPSGIERPGLVAGTAPPPDPEAIRGAKEWLSKRFPPARAYKPTLDQAPMTRLLDLDLLHNRGLASYLRVERAVRFLANAVAGDVYPGVP